MLHRNKWSDLWPTLKRLLSYGIPCSKQLMMAAIMLWLAAALEVLGTVVVSRFIDHILPKNILPIVILLKLIFLFLLLQTTSAILRYYQTILFNYTALSVLQKLRTDVMNASLRQPLIVLNNQPVGQLISRVTNDTEIIKDLYITAMASVLLSTALISAMLIAMFWLNWKLACIALILFPLVIIVMWLYQHYSTPLVRKMRIYIADINNGFNEAINGMEIIQQFRQQKRFGDRLYQASRSHFKTRMKTLKLEGYLLRPLLSLLFTLVLCCLLLIFGLNKHNTIGVGVLYAFINYLNRLNEPLIELTSQQSILQQSVVAGERIFEIIDSPSQKYGKDNRPIKEGIVELINVNFSYNVNSPILKNISFIAKAKSFIALVGHTGSGKSTLASLIMGYYPVNSGKLLIDRRQIETLSHLVLRQGVAMVQQDPIIMAETVYNNITLGRKISEKRVWFALKQVKLDGLIKSLPGGLFAELGEQGNTLSVGQKQLLALARVLISNPNILILDEATSNIDSGTEQTISQTLKDMRDNTTLIVIAHRLSTVVEADSIFVLHHGEIVEEGTHNELLKYNGKYYQLYQLQQMEKSLRDNN